MAFRGHFEGDQTCDWFIENPEVVIKHMKKTGKNDADQTKSLLKIHYYVNILAKEFAEDWDVKITTRELNMEDQKIQLLDLLIWALAPTENVTMEPYIDHSQFTKWLDILIF